MPSATMRLKLRTWRMSDAFISLTLVRDCNFVNLEREGTMRSLLMSSADCRGRHRSFRYSAIQQSCRFPAVRFPARRVERCAASTPRAAVAHFDSQQSMSKYVTTRFTLPANPRLVGLCRGETA